MTTHPADDAVERAVREQRLVAVLRLRDHGRAVAVAETLVEAGVKVLEFTLDHPDALGAIRAVAGRLPEGAFIGAGTVLDTTQVAAARAAGATFCVSPHADPEVIAACRGAGLAPLPGIATATELVTARRAGATLLKLFPAGPLGVGYLKALRGPFADAELVPTGGVELDDIATWLRAGATAVGVGSSLVDRQGTLDGLAERARRAVAAVRDAAERGADS
ncbi:MAG: bifunctional 4-hydroxy-2-oxoglutarate aldolase/2-dehydro-3-deoxy-phosphogluconate aldolase [Streptosporangiales bacterium]|nr:bifunctional 4-hydroxy-2-oxoglutarate aldolase/2-dehydro-3-deoxy-phosphogluconate aldolase [Streptosporangiales bacterium]